MLLVFVQIYKHMKAAKLCGSQVGLELLSGLVRLNIRVGFKVSI